MPLPLRPRRRAAVAAATAALALGLVSAPSTAEAAGPAPFGPDVSGWQHPSGARIDWAKVKAGGSSFVIAKATEGSGYTNPYLASDVVAARANGLAVGTYHFARPALPLSTASAQASRFAAVIGEIRTPGTLPPVLDLEVSGGLSTAQLVTWAQIFTETVRAQTGRTPVLYTYPSFWAVQMGGSRAFSRTPLWLASYRSTPPPPVSGWAAWSMWQYTASASVPGIIGDTDMSQFAGDATAFAAFADGTVPTPWPVTAPAAPVSVRAGAGVRSAGVRWVPSDDGGALPTSWTVTASPGGAQATVPGTSTTATVSGLREGVSYSFTVTATNVAGSSPTSAPSAPVMARGDAPGVPGAVRASVGKGKVSLHWAASSPAAASYVVRRCSPAPCSATAAIAGTTTAAYTDTAVLGGVTYDYAVNAVNRWGTSGVGPATAAMPLPTVDHLAAPTGVVATGSVNAVSLSWKPVPYAARYQVLRCAGASCVPGGRPVAVLDMPATRFAQAAAPGSTWTYAVRAVAGPLLSPAGGPATGTALIPQVMVVRSTPATPRAGQPTTLTVRLTRADTGAALAGRSVRVTFSPARGAVPRPVTLRTGATGLAAVVIRPQVNEVVSLRSAGRDVVTRVARAGVTVRPVLGAALSTPAARRGTNVVISGRTSPLYYGERVFRQVVINNTWQLVQPAPVQRDGSYRFVFRVPAKPGTMQTRVFIGRTALHANNGSATLALTAR